MTLPRRYTLSIEPDLGKHHDTEALADFFAFFVKWGLATGPYTDGIEEIVRCALARSDELAAWREIGRKLADPETFAKNALPDQWNDDAEALQAKARELLGEGGTDANP